MRRLILFLAVAVLAVPATAAAAQPATGGTEYFGNTGGSMAPAASAALKQLPADQATSGTGAFVRRSSCRSLTLEKTETVLQVRHICPQLTVDVRVAGSFRDGVFRGDEILVVTPAPLVVADGLCDFIGGAANVRVQSRTGGQWVTLPDGRPSGSQHSLSDARCVTRVFRRVTLPGDMVASAMRNGDGIRIQAGYTALIGPKLIDFSTLSLPVGNPTGG